MATKACPHKQPCLFKIAEPASKKLSSPIKELSPEDSSHTLTARPDSSQTSGLRDKASQLVERFGGECLSSSKLSIVKGLEAFKFKCTNGHIFYKFITQLKEMRPIRSRKFSKSTATSSSSSSDGDMMQESESLLSGIWCPKCESFFKSAAILAKNCGFRICGGLYAADLTFKCIRARHSTPISYQKRLQGNMKCAGCRKDEREAVKQRLREEERAQDEYYRQMQEKMFAEARQEMEKEMARGFSYPTHSSSVFMDEKSR